MAAPDQIAGLLEGMAGRLTLGLPVPFRGWGGRLRAGEAVRTGKALRAREALGSGRAVGTTRPGGAEGAIPAGSRPLACSRTLGPRAIASWAIRTGANPSGTIPSGAIRRPWTIAGGGARGSIRAIRAIRPIRPLETSRPEGTFAAVAVAIAIAQTVNGTLPRALGGPLSGTRVGTPGGGGTLPWASRATVHPLRPIPTGTGRGDAAGGPGIATGGGASTTTVRPRIEATIGGRTHGHGGQGSVRGW
jgi:hypothetical protein